MNIKKVLQYIALIFSFWVSVTMSAEQGAFNILQVLKKEGISNISDFILPLLFCLSVIGVVYPIGMMFFRYLYQKNSQVALVTSDFNGIYENNLLNFSTSWFFYWLCLDVSFKILPARLYGQISIIIMLLSALFFWRA